MCSVIYIRLGHTVNMPASFLDVGPIHLLPSKFLKGKFANIKINLDMMMKDKNIMCENVTTYLLP